MAKTGLKTTGFTALLKSLEEFPRRYTNKVIKPAIKSGMANVVLPDAKHMTPVKTGQLYRSLKVRVAKGDKGGRLPRGVVGFQVGAAQTSKIDAFYNIWVFAGAENRDGTKREGTKTLRKALYNNADRYLIHVLHEARQQFPKVVDEVRKANAGVKDRK